MPSSGLWFADISSHSEGSPSTFLSMFIATNVFNIDEVLFIFSFTAYAFDVPCEELLPRLSSQNPTPVSSQEFSALALTRR